MSSSDSVCCFVRLVCLNRVVSCAGPGELAETGRREQRELGQRVARRYRRLFHNTSPRPPSFYSSSSSRAVDSRRNFQRGLEAELPARLNATLSRSTYEVRDDLLRFYDACPRYIANVKRNRSAFSELEKFRRDSYPAVKRRIAERLMIDQLDISDGLC